MPLRNKAWEQFWGARTWLEKQGCWPTAGSLTHAISGLTPMPEEWDGAGNELKRCVIGLGDIFWESPGLGVAHVTVRGTAILVLRRHRFAHAGCDVHLR